jgi:hypothetical protein
MGNPARTFMQVYADSVAQGMEGAYRRLHQVANEKLDEQIAMGNNAYVMRIDGKAQYDRTFIGTARKSVILQFPSRGIKIALEILYTELYRAIRATAYDEGNLAVSIRMFYGSADKPAREVFSSDEIENFLPGDYIEMFPDVRGEDGQNYAPFVNSLVHRGSIKSPHGKGSGFMGRAARIIRRKLGIRPSAKGGLSVRVGRSYAAAKHMYIPQAKPSGYRRVIPERATRRKVIPERLIGEMPQHIKEAMIVIRLSYKERGGGLVYG